MSTEHGGIVYFMSGFFKAGKRNVVLEFFPVRFLLFKGLVSKNFFMSRQKN